MIIDKNPIIDLENNTISVRYVINTLEPIDIFVNGLLMDNSAFIISDKTIKTVDEVDLSEDDIIIFYDKV